MWNTIHISSNLNYAKKIETMLKNEGFFVRIRDFSPGDGKLVYELQALVHEAKDAHEFIIENGIR
ncbi:hypothetical protein E9840_03975 [Tissierella creatinini]|nr:hypothetical protein E9840_03975 [Tissierella creatinini]TJX67377.1 hypothetical protein E8P77_05325 [Soehngenia saccharolytica]